MLSFPLDNVQYEATALGAWLGTRNRGVFSAGNNFGVSAAGGMQISVSPGLAWLEKGDLEGIVCIEEDTKNFSIAAADAQLSRLDIVCMQLNKGTNQATIIVKEGTPEANPVIVPPVRNSEYDEIYLASVLVPAGATELVAENITDMRLNKSYCGLVRDGVTMVPIEMLSDQIQELIIQIRMALEQQAVSGEVLNGTITTEKLADSAVTKYFTTNIGTNWQNRGASYFQPITVNGILESDKPFVDIMLSDEINTAKEQLDAWGTIYKIVSSENKITVYAAEPTKIIIPIQMEVHRK